MRVWGCLFLNHFAHLALSLELNFVHLPSKKGIACLQIHLPAYCLGTYLSVCLVPSHTPGPGLHPFGNVSELTRDLLERPVPASRRRPTTGNGARTTAPFERIITTVAQAIAPCSCCAGRRREGGEEEAAGFASLCCVSDAQDQGE